MDRKTEKYFENEIILLKSYGNMFGDAIIHSRKDKIRGAIQFGLYLGLLSQKDVQDIQTKMFSASDELDKNNSTEKGGE